MHIILLYLILIIHTFLIGFIVVTPFVTRRNAFLILHAIVVPMIMLHWFLNDNTCALTIAEYKVREYLNNGRPVNRDQCFMARLIDPVYDFKKNHGQCKPELFYSSMFILWFISLMKLYNNYKIGILRGIQDLDK